MYFGVKKMMKIELNNSQIRSVFLGELDNLIKYYQFRINKLRGEIETKIRPHNDLFYYDDDEAQMKYLIDKLNMCENFKDYYAANH